MKKLEVLQIFCTFIDDIQQVANVLDMTADCKVTELFCIIDDFCKHYDAENAGNLQEDNSGVKRRRRAASLSDSEIMTILLYFHFGTFRNKQPRKSIQYYFAIYPRINGQVSKDAWRSILAPFFPEFRCGSSSSETERTARREYKLGHLPPK